jgi:hypothetical protein
MLYTHSIIGQVMCRFLVSPKVFIPLLLNACLKFLGSLANSVNIKGFSLLGIRGVSKLPVFLAPLD